MKSTWGLRSSLSFEIIKTLIWGPLLRRRFCLMKPWVPFEQLRTLWAWGDLLKQIVLNSEGKLWGTTAAPVQSSSTWGVRLAYLPFVIWRWKRIEHLSAQKFALTSAWSDIVGWLYCLNGLKDAIRKDNQMKMEMGLEMPSNSWSCEYQNGSYTGPYLESWSKY